MSPTGAVPDLPAERGTYLLWFELEGLPGESTLPRLPGPGRSIRFASGGIVCDIVFPYVSFDGFAMKPDVIDSDGRRATGLHLYRGKERELDFNAMQEAAVVLALSMRTPSDPEGDRFRDLRVRAHNGSVLARWERGHERLFKELHDRVFQEYAEMPWGG